MNVHILVSDVGVEVFPSRRKMTERRVKVGGRMLPPVSVNRDAKGLIHLANLINKIHVEGWEAAIEDEE